MAHYALLDETGLVVNVITGRNENEIVGDITDWERFYSDETGLTVVRTSFNTYGNKHAFGGTPFRFNYAGIGYTFDPSRGTDGAFIPPKPFESWILNEETCLWEAPVAYPEDGLAYSWDETAGDWVEVVQA